MDQFAQHYNFTIVTSSPRYPQSNGLAEKCVSTVKRWMKKDCDLYESLMEYRNTPVGGLPYSPAQMLMNRVCRTRIPVHPKQLQPAVPINVRDYLAVNQMTQKYYYDRQSQPLETLREGQSVQIKKPSDKFWSPAIVDGSHHTPNSYVVTTSDGSQYRRNRRHIKETSVPPITPNMNFDDPSDTTSTSIVSTDHNKDDSASADMNNQSMENNNSPRRSMRECKVPQWHKDFVM